MALDRMGRSVSIVDADTASFRRLRAGFGGKTVRGVGFDRDTLIEAGIETADAFAAVSNGDNSNIISARVARETFNVPVVVARIYDPRRAEIYERLGIPTVATVAWTTGQFLRRIDPGGAVEVWRDATGTLVIIEVDYDPTWIGRAVRDVARDIGIRVAFLTRFGNALLPTDDTVLQDGDLLHVLCHPEDKAKVIEAVATPPGRAG